MDLFSIKLINLFPYNYEGDQKFKYESTKYSAPEECKKYKKNSKSKILFDDDYENINQTLFTHTSIFLWNIGALIYEMYFNDFPYIRTENKIEIKKLKESFSKDFDDLIDKLIVIDPDKRIKWTEYINHNFLNLEPTKIFKILFQNEINLKENIGGLNLGSYDISCDIIDKISKIEFKNLFWINLSYNKLQNLTFLKGKSFENLKILIAENNIIKNLCNEKQSNLFEHLEFLFLSFNSLSNLISFEEINLRGLLYLSLSRNSISNISYLVKANLNKLSILDLSFNKIKDLSDLSEINCINLKELYLNNNKIEDLEVFGNIFENLEILNLENNQIININIFKNAKFIHSIKELYLDFNPIKEYEDLNLCYLQSLDKISISTTNKNLRLIGIKMKLYGYEMDENNLEKISILFLPIKLSNIMKNDINNYNYTNCFKIIANNKVKIEELYE